MSRKPKSGTTPFRPRARLLKLIGEELISDDVVAVAELVKNAHDAKFDMGPVITIALIVAVFAIVMLFGLGAVSSIARGFRGARRGEDVPSMRRLPAPDRPTGGGPDERAEQIAARIALIDRNQAVAGGAYSSREVFTRRTGEIADAVAATPLLASDRLGQAYSRAPRPVTRRGEEG